MPSGGATTSGTMSMINAIATIAPNRTGLRMSGSSQVVDHAPNIAPPMVGISIGRIALFCNLPDWLNPRMPVIDC